MARLLETVISFYFLYALATLAHNLNLRFISGSASCRDLDCLANMGETLVWSLIWPFYWPMYYGWL